MHDVVVRDLEAARNRTLGLTDLDEIAAGGGRDGSPIVGDHTLTWLA